MGIYARHNDEWYRVDEGGGELPGIGGWATITDVKGKGNKYSYTDADGDWVAYEFTNDGELTTQAGGLVEALIVSGGTGYWANALASPYALPGFGKGWTAVVHLDGPTHEIVIGNGGQSLAGGANGMPAMGQETKLGQHISGTHHTAHASISPPIISFITGSEVEYAGASNSPIANSGDGGLAAGAAGASGVVIVRVPKANDGRSDIAGSEAGESFDITTTRQAIVEAVEEKVESVKDTMIIDGRERKVKRNRKR